MSTEIAFTGRFSFEAEPAPDVEGYVHLTVTKLEGSNAASFMIGTVIGTCFTVADNPLPIDAYENAPDGPVTIRLQTEAAPAQVIYELRELFDRSDS